jgi:hypothetical protein
MFATIAGLGRKLSSKSPRVSEFVEDEFGQTFFTELPSSLDAELKSGEVFEKSLVERSDPRTFGEDFS